MKIRENAMVNFRFITLMIFLLSFAGLLIASPPTSNPVRAYYGNGYYPIWTDSVQWSNVIDMSEYNDGADWFEKFENARDDLHAQGGGVMYFPAGVYDFSSPMFDTAQGRGLMLKSGVVIRGERPGQNEHALDDTLGNQTVFKFPYTDKGDGNEIPKAWNFIGLMPSEGEDLKEVDHVGVVWVRLEGASVYFGGQCDFGNTWATADAWYSSKAAVGRWADRVPDGTHPMDIFAGAPLSGSYLGAGSGRLVMGCALVNSTVSNDNLINYAKEKFDTIDDFYYMYKFGARIGIYGDDVFVANNWLPKSDDCFKYGQTTAVYGTDSNHWSTLLFDYGKIFGLDINKGYLNPFNNNVMGYKHENVVVRDNFVYNHGSKGFELSGKWLLVRNNINERDFLQEGADIYGLGSGWELTLDGFNESQPGGSGKVSDNLSRAFDMAGAYGWIDSNYYNNTGSNPGNDGEGILWQAHGGMSTIESFSITRNEGLSGYMAGYDVSQYGALWAWNKPEAVGNYKAGDMYDVSIVENNAAPITTTTEYSVLDSCPSGTLAAPSGVSADLSPGKSFVEISWSDNSDSEIGFRLERKVGASGNWETISYRPRQDNINSSPGTYHELRWRDYMPARGVDNYYRVVAVNCDDDDAGASNETSAVFIDDEVTSVNNTKKEEKFSWNLHVYPLPASEILNIESDSGFKLELLTLAGQIVTEQISQMGQYQLDVSGFTPGVYILRVLSGQKVQTRKVLIR